MIERKVGAAPGGRPPLSLRVNFSWTLLGNVVYAGCQWGLLMALAKLAAPEMVGRFALGIAITGPIFMFTNLSLRMAQATDSKQEYTFADYFGHRLLATLLGLVLVVVVVGVTGYESATAAVVLMVGGAKALEALADICYGLAQAREQMDRIAYSMLLKGPLSLALTIAAVYATHDAFWAAAAMTVAWGAVFLTYDLRTIRLLCDPSNPAASRPRWNRKVLLRLTRLALPLGVAMMLLSLYINIPRYFLEHYQGEYALGIFAAMAYIMQAGITVVNSLGQAASPRLARLYAEGRRAQFYAVLTKVSMMGLAMGLAGVALAVWLGPELLTILYRPEYAVEQEAFVWIMVAAALSFVLNFLGTGIIATRAFHRQLLPFVCTVLTALICSWWWVPDYGIRGAAWAFLAATSVNLLLFLEVLRTQPVSPKGG